MHGNKDAERESMRTDASVVSLIGFRTVCSVACTFGMVMGKADVRGAYTQSGDARRKIYVRLSFRERSTEKYWLSKTTSYGIVSAGRKWQRKSDEVVQKVLGLDIVVGMPQLFFRPMGQGDPAVILAKYVDDKLCAARSKKETDETNDGINQAVELGSWKQWPDVLDVNSTEVVQTRTNIQVTARMLKEEVDVVVLQPGRRKHISSELTDGEASNVRSMAGKLGYFGVAISPLASFSASYIQQILPKMTVAGLKHANGIAKDLLRRDIKLEYARPTVGERRNARIAVFTDAGYPHTGVEKKVAQEGCIVGVAFGTEQGAPYHIIGWLSKKQRRVSNSSIQAECIATVTSVGFARYCANIWENITGNQMPITIVTDSLGLHHTLAMQARQKT